MALYCSALTISDVGSTGSSLALCHGPDHCAHNAETPFTVTSVNRPRRNGATRNPRSWRGMRVIGLRRDPAGGRGAADAVHAMGELKSLLPGTDFVALTRPLTRETERLVDAEALGRMKPTAHLVNVARGRVVYEPAFVE